MKEISDEELQKWFENNEALSQDVASDDAKAYHALFEALRHEPEDGLPYDFATKVTRCLRADGKRSNEIRTNLLAAFVFIAGIAVLCGSMAIFNPLFGHLVLQYIWALLLLPMIFIAIQYFDQKLLRKSMFRRNGFNNRG